MLCIRWTALFDDTFSFVGLLWELPPKISAEGWCTLAEANGINELGMLGARRRSTRFSDLRSGSAALKSMLEFPRTFDPICRVSSAVPSRARVRLQAATTEFLKSIVPHEATNIPFITTTSWFSLYNNLIFNTFRFF
jgi:hypothetical protein